MTIRNGMAWLKFDKWKPRLFLNEKHEKRVKWVLRALTIVGIVTSVVTLKWYLALSLSIVLVLLDALLENTLFYYTSLYVLAVPDFKWDPDKWLANVFVSFGHPQDSKSDRIVGLVFSDVEYAKNFFNLLKTWNNGSPENTEDNFFLSFVIDEDTYYVYLYPNVQKKSVKEMHAKLEKDNAVRKFGKEHIGLVMQMIICKGFHTTGDFALGQFVEHQPDGQHFLLGPFLWSGAGQPKPILEIEPISLIHYKAKTAGELTEDDMEYWHWKNLVAADRVAIGKSA